jgi:hypothetical protein
VAPLEGGRARSQAAPWYAHTIPHVHMAHGTWHMCTWHSLGMRTLCDMCTWHMPCVHMAHALRAHGTCPARTWHIPCAHAYVLLSARIPAPRCAPLSGSTERSACMRARTARSRAVYAPCAHQTDGGLATGGARVPSRPCEGGAPSRRRAPPSQPPRKAAPWTAALDGATGSKAAPWTALAAPMFFFLLIQAKHRVMTSLEARRGRKVCEGGGGERRRG